MRISTVKPYLAVNLHHLFSDGAAVDTQSRISFDKLRNIAFIIEGDSSAITNAICPSLSVNYGSVY